jgi:hypothetical protein
MKNKIITQTFKDGSTISIVHNPLLDDANLSDNKSKSTTRS